MLEKYGNFYYNINMRNQIYILGVSLTIISLLPSFSLEMSIDDYLSYVENKNTEINYYKTVSASLEYKIKTAYIPQNPSLELERMYVGNSEEKSFYIKQNLVNPLKSGMYKKNAKLDYESYLLEYETIRNKILAEAEIVYYDYLFVLKKKKALSDISAVADSVISVSKYQPQKSSLEILRAETEYSDINKRLKELETQEKLLLNKLRSFTGDYEISLSTDIAENIFSNYDKKNLISKLFLNPEILKAKKDEEILNVALKISKTSYLPDFMIGYRKRTIPSSYDIILGIDLPIFFNKNAAQIKEARLIKEAYSYEYKKKFTEKEYMLNKILLNLENYTDLFYYHKNVLLPKSNAEFNLSLSLYQKGEADISQVTESLKRNLEIKIDYYKYLFEFYKTKTELKELLGRKL